MLSERLTCTLLMLGGLLLSSCGLVTGSSDSVLQPRFDDGGLLAHASALARDSARSLEGLWDSTAGASLLGSSLVLHESPGHVSVFGNRDATYAVLQAGCLDDGRLVLEGYHRRAIDTATGLVRLFVEPAAAARSLCRGSTAEASLELVGTYGTGDSTPDRTLVLRRRRALPSAPATMVVAHRGGCRSSDACGASENSLEVLRLAQRLGADRVEVDVQVTRDGIPIVYHDSSFGPLLTNGRYCRGAVSDFDWAHVTQLCELRYGEAVPKLEDALRTVVEDTELVGIWLDVKTPAGMAAALPPVRKWDRIASDRGRNLRIVIGLSSEALVDAWVGLGSPRDVECLVELGVDDLHRTGCLVWAPRWTLGPMASTVAQVKAEGHTVAFWTLDEQEFIDMFIRQAKPNGLLTNRPGLALQRSYLATVQAEQASGGESP